MGRKKGLPGVSFSLNRALGVTKAKQNFARKTGIPTTRAGMQRKAGAAMGCIVPMLIVLGVAITLIVA